MRNIDTVLEERINSSMQTIGENANPAVQMRIQRHDVPLHDEELIERSRIVHRAGLTDSDVAVCHPYFEREDGRIWVAYVREGILHVKWAENMEILSRSEWNDYWFTDYAIACSIAFDSKVKHNPQGIWEFITEEIPWVFWVTPEGQLKAKLCTPLGQYEHELAIANVTDVSAVRGASGDYGNWDFGLNVFFVMGGNLYYRQMINDVWYDAELIQHPDLNGLTIQKIKAFNTWDYRAGVQILTSDGDLYELYSYTEGLGTRSQEHTMINYIEGSMGNFKLQYVGESSFQTKEHTSIGYHDNEIYNYSTNTEIPKKAENVSDINGNWGTTIEIRMSEKATGALNTDFSLTDGTNIYQCMGVIYNKRIIRLAFQDFNDAMGNLTVIYTPGTLATPIADVNGFSITFTPEHLGEYIPPVPKVVSAANDGERTITVNFDRDLYNASTDISEHLTVYSNKFAFYPDYPTSNTERINLTIASTQAVSGNNRAIQINLTDTIKGAIGDVGILYDGFGGLNGENGNVEAFDKTFTPTDLPWFVNPNAIEHTEINFHDCETLATLTKIDFHDYQAPNEHTTIGYVEGSMGNFKLTYVGEL